MLSFSFPHISDVVSEKIDSRARNMENSLPHISKAIPESPVQCLFSLSLTLNNKISSELIVLFLFFVYSTDYIFYKMCESAKLKIIFLMLKKKVPS